MTTKQVLNAIDVVKRHLDEEWISDGCVDNESFGCASCRALALRRDLSLLADFLVDDEDSIPQ